MPLAVACSYWIKVSFMVIVVCFLWKTAGCCENSTEATGNRGIFHHPNLNNCITDIVRAVCNALRPSPMKRNTELINSILGLPRVLQDAGR